MITKGRETRYIEVEIKASDFIRTFRDKWLGKEVGMYGDHCFINDNGDWENWEDGPGSGHAVYGRNATQYELEVMESFDRLISLAQRGQY